MQNAGFFGKHPAFGDFISHGLPSDLRDEVQDWLTATLAQSQQSLGSSWSAVWDTASPIRFWLGGNVLRTCNGIKGVIVPSRDKVGRRFPLVVLARFAFDELPPILQPQQQLYDAWEQEIALSIASDGQKVGNLLPLIGISEASQPLAPDTLWATNPNADISELLKAVGAVDHTRAAEGRSYWWVKPNLARQGAVWTCSGLPEADAMVWLLSGVAQPDPAGDRGAQS